jgi:hypothetical protein
MAQTLMTFSSSSSNAKTKNNTNSNNSSMSHCLPTLYLLSDSSSAGAGGRKRIDDVALMSDKTKKRRFAILDEKLGDVGMILLSLNYLLLGWKKYFLFILLVIYSHSIR